MDRKVGLQRHITKEQHYIHSNTRAQMNREAETAILNFKLT